MAIDTMNHTRKDVMLIEGNVTDWDSSNLSFNVSIDSFPSKVFNIIKEANTEAVPFLTNISLNTTFLGENNLTIIVTDNDNISSNLTITFHVHGIDPEFSILSNDYAEYSKDDYINVNISINQIDIADKLFVHYSFDVTENWNLAKEIDLNNDVKLPFNVSFGIRPNLSERIHSIKLKCTDNNGLESKKNPTMKFSIKKEEQKEIIETTHIFTNTPSFNTDDPFNKHKVSSAEKTAIIYGVVGVVVVIVIAIIGVFINAKCHHDDSSCQTTSDDVKQICTIDMSIVVKRDDYVVDFNESSSDFIDEEIESILDASF